MIYCKTTKNHIERKLSIKITIIIIIQSKNMNLTQSDNLK